jgi:hypothetical protein
LSVEAGGEGGDTALGIRYPMGTHQPTTTALDTQYLTLNA